MRHGGIESQIMVFNPDLTSMPEIVRYRLEPEVYTFEQLRQIVEYSRQNDVTIGIHLKLDTGMHRLGFLENDMDELCHTLKSSKKTVVKTIFSHLASSEDENDDQYTFSQFSKFDKMYDQISRELGYTPKRHILNSGGISRFADHQYDYVRLGVGMYGIDNNPEIYKNLRKVHVLSASLIQVKHLKKGDSVGYNRRTILEKDSMVGIVNIGYADGVMRCLGNRNYSYLIAGAEAPIIGNVCMDVTIVDLSNVPNAQVGMTVEIFGNQKKIEVLSESAGTIPYEILSRISSRVQRNFVRE